MSSPDRSLRVIAEDEEINEEGEEEEEEKKPVAQPKPFDDLQDGSNGNQGLTEEELSTLST